MAIPVATPRAKIRTPSLCRDRPCANIVILVFLATPPALASPHLRPGAAGGSAHCPPPLPPRQGSRAGLRGKNAGGPMTPGGQGDDPQADQASRLAFGLGRDHFQRCSSNLTSRSLNARSLAGLRPPPGAPVSGPAVSVRLHCAVVVLRPGMPGFSGGTPMSFAGVPCGKCLAGPRPSPWLATGRVRGAVAVLPGGRRRACWSASLLNPRPIVSSDSRAPPPPPPAPECGPRRPTRLVARPFSGTCWGNW